MAASFPAAAEGGGSCSSSLPPSRCSPPSSPLDLLLLLPSMGSGMFNPRALWWLALRVSQTQLSRLERGLSFAKPSVVARLVVAPSLDGNGSDTTGLVLLPVPTPVGKGRSSSSWGWRCPGSEHTPPAPSRLVVGKGLGHSPMEQPLGPAPPPASRPACGWAAGLCADTAPLLQRWRGFCSGAWEGKPRVSYCRVKRRLPPNYCNAALKHFFPLCGCRLHISMLRIQESGN